MPSAQQKTNYVYDVYIVCRIAFIDFDTVESAQAAMKKMNNKNLNGRQVSIDFAETRDGGKLVVLDVFCS